MTAEERRSLLHVRYRRIEKADGSSVHAGLLETALRDLGVVTLWPDGDHLSDGFYTVWNAMGDASFRRVHEEVSRLVSTLEELDGEENT